MLFFHLTMVLPTSPACVYTYTISGLHAILWFTCSITFLLTACRDPGYLEKEYDILKLLQNFHPDDICPRCEVLTTPRSQHCSLCDKCVEGWDHHCPWLNNCIGAYNRRSFFIFLLSLFLLMLLNIEPPITSQMLKSEDDGDEKTEKLWWIYKDLCFCGLCNHDTLTGIVFLIQAICFIICTVIICWILILTFKRYASDGAQIEETEGNMIS